MVVYCVKTNTGRSLGGPGKESSEDSLLMSLSLCDCGGKKTNKNISPIYVKLDWKKFRLLQHVLIIVPLHSHCFHLVRLEFKRLFKPDGVLVLTVYALA